MSYEPYSQRNTRHFVLYKNETSNTWNIRAIRKHSHYNILRTPVMACKPDELKDVLKEIATYGIPVLPDTLFNKPETIAEANTYIKNMPNSLKHVS